MIAAMTRQPFAVLRHSILYLGLAATVDDFQISIVIVAATVFLRMKISLSRYGDGSISTYGDGSISPYVDGSISLYGDIAVISCSEGGLRRLMAFRQALLLLL